ncbi:PLD nuclease N-terminal domain-containing protein [Opitutus sp. GAS368]|uniref:PLD nuclease N-terminal domain-containing protein n=1 Tax=Opitutus sp. GAS368 TaxID=1882749 RepID=UPI000B8243E0|nr:PLD nuclease N-terminal domain-containing protein [Opitutus sp. GAS368]
MNSTDQLSGIMAGGIMMMLASVIFGIGMLGFWLFALIHCLTHRHDKDRIVWVLVTLLGGPIGAALYFMIGRQKTPNPPQIVAHDSPPPALVHAQVSQTSFDHSAMHDEKQRAKSISDAVWGEAKSSRSKGR